MRLYNHPSLTIFFLFAISIYFERKQVLFLKKSEKIKSVTFLINNYLTTQKKRHIMINSYILFRKVTFSYEDPRSIFKSIWILSKA